MNPTEQAHKELRNLLLNGRILVNGIPPTAVEITQMIQGEQMLFEKAMKLDAAMALAAKKHKKPEKEEVTIGKKELLKVRGKKNSAEAEK